MPGAGKSTVGVVLAKLSGLRFVDTDLEIQQREQATLQAILEQSGYLRLRAIEQEVLLHSNLDNAVISTGGSVVYSAAVMRRLRGARGLSGNRPGHPRAPCRGSTPARHRQFVAANLRRGLCRTHPAVSAVHRYHCGRRCGRCRRCGGGDTAASGAPPQYHWLQRPVAHAHRRVRTRPDSARQSQFRPRRAKIRSLQAGTKFANHTVAARLRTPRSQGWPVHGRSKAQGMPGKAAGRR